MLDPLAVHLPLVQTEEERVGRVFLRRASSSQALGQRRRGVPRLLVQHLGFDHMVPVLPLQVLDWSSDIHSKLGINQWWNKVALIIVFALTGAFGPTSACTITMSLSRTSAVKVAKRGSQEGKFPFSSIVVITWTQSSGVWNVVTWSSHMLNMFTSHLFILVPGDQVRLNHLLQLSSDHGSNLPWCVPPPLLLFPLHLAHALNNTEISVFLKKLRTRI